jgi:CheY-like chemotaxis protein
MDTFRALVVDDDPAIRQLAKAVATNNQIEVDTAPDLAAAEDLLVSNFYNTAYVDLDLKGKAQGNTDGVTLLREIFDARPTCRRVLLTRYSQRYPKKVFELIDPDCLIIDGARDKQDITHLFVEYLTAEAERWLRAPVRIDGLQDIFAKIERRQYADAKLLDGRSLDATVQELDYVISRLMGQGLAPDTEDPDDIGHIALQLLEGGKSRSLVTTGRATSRAGSEGIRCVIKVGTRADTVEERRRYDRYVRFRMSLHRRVELLGHAVGDTLGAVCYSFAGRSPNAITDLQSLLDAEDPRALDCMRSLLGEAEDWRPDGGPGQDLAGFFGHAYNLDVRDVTREVSEFAERKAEVLDAHKVGNTLRLKGGKLTLPSGDDLGDGELRGTFGASVVHGDMNASNVILSDEGHVILIDFRHTTRGPRALDFAALQCSIRLSHPDGENAISSAVVDLQTEKRLWDHDWSRDSAWWPQTARKQPPYWARAAACLMELAHTSLQGLTTHEHAATTLFYALRIFRVASLDTQSRFRLLVWISALLEAVERANGTTTNAP